MEVKGRHGTGVIGDSEEPDVVLGTELWSFGKAVHDFNRRIVSPAPNPTF